MSRTGFSRTETRAVLSLASLYLVRMLGLFMLLPVLSLYARDVDGATPFLIGIALGIYGLSQACLQLPLGMLSDRIGRRPVIIVSQLVFLLGSLVAAAAGSIWGIIAGRALQGAGAVASTLMALLADVTREHNRTKAMAAVGASIGVSFAIAIVAGPVITAWAGLSGLFLSIAVLAALGVLLAVYVVPVPVGGRTHQAAPTRALLGQVLRDRQLLRLDGGVLVLHFIMTASFIAVPLVLADHLHIARESHGHIYGALLATAFVAMVPAMIYAERRRQVKRVFLAAVGVVLLALALLALVARPQTAHEEAAVFGLLWLYFVGFNYLEAALPSLLSRATRRENRGTASGVYSTGQFLGAFLGGSIGGLTLQHAGVNAVFALCALLALAWLGWSIGMDGPQYLRSITLSLDVATTEEVSAALQGLPGVREVLVVAGENIAYVQVDAHFDDQHLHGLPVKPVQA
jgi:MFS family permease